MSVLRKVRGTFQNVQQDITAGLRSIGQDKQHSGGSTSARGQKAINLNAGADLLNKYQDDWHDLHEYNEVNAHSAQAVAEQISTMSTALMSQAVAVTKLRDEMITLPTMQQQLHTTTADLCSIEDMCHQIEVSLVQLENLCEFCELQTAKESHRQQLVVYRESKTEHLERMRVQFAQEHADKVRKSEQARKETLKERQATFDQAFTDDVNYYKIHGFTEQDLKFQYKFGQPSVNEEDPEDTLASIVINDDTTDLDTFLDTAETAASTSSALDSKAAPEGDSDKPPSESVSTENRERLTEIEMRRDDEEKTNGDKDQNEPDEGDSIYHVEDEDDDESDNEEDYSGDDNEDDDDDDDDNSSSKESDSKLDENTESNVTENVPDSLSENDGTVQELLPDKVAMNVGTLSKSDETNQAILPDKTIENIPDSIDEK